MYKSTKVRTQQRSSNLDLNIEFNLTNTFKNIKCVIRSVIINYRNETLTKL